MPTADFVTVDGVPHLPLYDPKKQDVHYRASRARILRNLGLSTHRNGSQFAVLFVSPDGEVADAYASEGLQPKLEGWITDQIRVEAKELTKEWAQERTRRARIDVGARTGSDDSGAHGDAGRLEQADEDMSDGDDGEADADSAKQPYRATAETMRQGGSTFVGSPASGFATNGTFGSQALDSSSSNSFRPGHRSTRSIAGSSSHPSPSFSAKSAPSPALPSATLTSTPSPTATPMTFTPNRVEQWFSDRFAELSHKTDKIVCRSWIKVVEPSKQTHFPYQKGDETKPTWWPKDIRHKEPDHLGKPERIALLLHLIRLPQISVDVLEAATAAVIVQIPVEKMAILHVIYEVAKAERAAIAASPNGTYDHFSVTLTTRPIASSEDDAAMTLSPVLAGETRSTKGSRHKARPSVGSPGALDSSHAQQTPRSVRAAPYPLSRSASATQDLANLSFGTTSPSLSATPASTSLSRSQSHAGLGSATRPRRLTGRSSVGEADYQSTPYSGGRVRPSVTPRSQQQNTAQASPLSASMGRSASTSAIGAKTMMDDSVASPAMIKSRSKLSQKCFEQMGVAPQNGPVGHRQVVAGPGNLEYQPQHVPKIHPHHLQQPTKVPAPPSHPQHQQHHHQLQQRSQQPYQAPPRTMLQQHPNQVHPHPLQQPLPHHPRQAQGHPHPAHAQPVRPQLQSHPSAPQVQVQVQVHQGNELSHHVDPSMPYLVNYPQHAQAYSASPVHVHPSHFAPTPPQLQQQQRAGQFAQSNGAYEHASSIQPHQVAAHEAYLVAQSGGTPHLPGYVNSPQLSQHSTGGHGQDYLIAQANPNEPSSRSPSFDPSATNYYLTNAIPHSAPEADLGAYVQQLEAYERDQADAASLGLGLGFDPNSHSGGSQLGHVDLSPFGAHDGYYDMDGGFVSTEFSPLSAVAVDPNQARKDDGRLRYDDQAFGILGHA
ncbi:hypothetical protein JCM10212_000427 [Sporobolomyces blumeae]